MVSGVCETDKRQYGSWFSPSTMGSCTKLGTGALLTYLKRHSIQFSHLTSEEAKKG